MSGEDEHCQDVSDDMLVNLMIQEELSQEESVDDGDETSAPHPSCEETLRAASLAKRYSVARTELSGPLHTRICNLQRSIPDESHDARRQLTLNAMMERDYS